MASTAYGAAGAGSVLTSEDVSRSLLMPLEASSIVLAALTQATMGPDDVRPRGVDGMIAPAAPIIVSSHGLPVRIPKLADLDEPTFVLEGTQIPEAQATYDEVVLLGPNIRALKILHLFSSELARAAVGNVQSLLTTALTTKMARGIDRAFLVGDPAITPGSPTGIFTMADTQTIDAAGPATVDLLMDMWGLALAANARPTAWLMSPRSLTSLRKQRAAPDGAYLLQSDPTMAGAYSLLGAPVFASTAIPIDGGTANDETSIALIDARQIAVGRDADLLVKILDQTYGSSDRIGVRVVSRWDVAPINPAGIVIATGVTA